MNELLKKIFKKYIDDFHAIDKLESDGIIEDEDTWINVDTTFSVAGNYFDNASFGDNHIEKGIAGEF